MIKLHHLNQSRSKRIIWLLEELGVDYEIVPYLRDSVTFLTPPELKSIHPLGKSLYWRMAMRSLPSLVLSLNT